MRKETRKKIFDKISPVSNISTSEVSLTEMVSQGDTLIASQLFQLL